jgi:transcriptional regulator with XRE-family HTH domain
MSVKRPRGRPRNPVDPAIRTPEQLRLWREGRGYSQSALARLRGVHHQTVSRWETGEVAILRTVEYALRYLEAH